MRQVLAAAACVAGLLLVATLSLLVLGFPVGQSLQQLFEGSFSSGLAISRTLARMTPLLLTGTGICIAWRAGMYNIGGEGQFVIGGLAGGALAAPFIEAGSWWLSLGILASSALAGAVYGLLAGWLQVRRGVQVVVSTILLNFVALQALDWAVSGPLQDKSTGVPLSAPLPASSMFPRLSIAAADGGRISTDLHAGIFVALFVAVIFSVMLFATRFGFKLRVVGGNPLAARAARIDVGRVQLGAMLISGGLCGLAGGVEYLGVSGQLGTGFSQQWGFIAIPVALLGGLHPLGVVFSALLFGVLLAGSENMARFVTSSGPVVFVVQGVAVLAFLAYQALRSRPEPAPEDA